VPSEKLKIEDMCVNPTNLSRKILEIAETSLKKYEPLFNSKSIVSNVKLRLLYMTKSSEIFSFVDTYNYQNIKKKDILGLFEELSSLFDIISLNNILFSYSYLVEKNKDNQVITKEDMKLDYFRKLSCHDITVSEFKKEFGHYGLNPYELSSRRFFEYTPDELMKLSKLAKTYRLLKSISLKEYMSGSKKSLYVIYAALRAELKNISMYVISELRYKLLEFKKSNLQKSKDQELFGLEYDELKRKITCHGKKN
jgi:hypothetical protein